MLEPLVNETTWSTRETNTGGNGFFYHTALAAICLGILIYFLVPFLFWVSARMQTHIIFLQSFQQYFLRRSFFQPETHGVEGGRNFYVKSSCAKNITIGIWHILPKSLAKDSKDATGDFWEKALQTSGKPVFLYFHGSAGSRAERCRIDVYKLLQEQDCHVIAFDYRGFADSSPVFPNESGLVEDGITVYSWLCEILGPDSNVPIFCWGHSLGTGVATHLTSKLILQGRNCLAGLVLEAPFTNMREEVNGYFVANIYRFWPYFYWIFQAPLRNRDLAFRSDKHILNIHIPIVILHVKNDFVVPYSLGYKLYEIATKFRPKTAKPVELKVFGELSPLESHIWICKSPKLPGVINAFKESCLRAHYAFEN